MVADGRSKHLKDENKSIDGKCHTKQIENTSRRDPHLSENRNLGSYVTSKSYIDIFNQCVYLKKNLNIFAKFHFSRRRTCLYSKYFAENIRFWGGGGKRNTNILVTVSV